MRCNAIVPQDHGLRSPFHLDLKVLAKCDMVIKKLQEVVTLLLLINNDMAGELRIHVQCFLACNLVCSNNRMDR